MGLLVKPGLEIPDAELEVAFVRSSGPGGQNVNKVASAVQLRFFLDKNVTLSEEVKSRLRILAGQRLNDAGELLIVARESRSQEQNRRIAEQKLLDLVRRALIAPRKRHATKPTRASKERRLDTKARKQRNKRLRGRVRFDD
ncbi:MAG TPA: alternative ribosome rescue aminoacyl-tRNA hydrolase ArfB [Steroidobacteraceae bacterium]|jgi:ribosome-associated protein|nr:alternative ribosome rescue aminoacyl-tRNA hydrolase ArfB [Steroidobacteraceae bacterium]